MRYIISALLAVLAVAGAPAARATVPNVFPGDLIKLMNDGDKTTHEDEAVYYFDTDWKRHPFPNTNVYYIWYKDFSGIKELTAAQMAEIRLAGPVSYRPGTRLIKIPSVPKVYALEPGGLLRWLETETVAKTLYGNDWAKRVDDVSETLFTSYREGAPLTAPIWPSGTIVRRASDTALFVIQGYGKRHIKPADADSLRVQDKFVITASSDLSDYADRGDVANAEIKLIDTSELAHDEIPGAPIVDFPVTLRSVERGKEQSLAALRISSSPPVLVKAIRVRLTGPLWSGGEPMLKDLKFVDVNGQNLFGTKQLETSGAPAETLDFSGAYTMPANAVSVMEFRATLSSSLPKGSKIEAAVERNSLSVDDSANGFLFTDFYPQAAFPVMTMEVK